MKHWAGVPFPANNDDKNDDKTFEKSWKTEAPPELMMVIHFGDVLKHWWDDCERVFRFTRVCLAFPPNVTRMTENNGQKIHIRGDFEGQTNMLALTCLKTRFSSWVLSEDHSNPAKYNETMLLSASLVDRQFTERDTWRCCVASLRVCVIVGLPADPSACKPRP